MWKDSVLKQSTMKLVMPPGSALQNSPTKKSVGISAMWTIDSHGADMDLDVIQCDKEEFVRCPGLRLEDFDNDTFQKDNFDGREAHLTDSVSVEPLDVHPM